MITTLIVLIVLSVGPALYMRRTAGKASVKHSFGESNGKPKRTLFVHLPGLMGDGVTQIQNVLDTFLERGDVLAVHYDGELGKEARVFDARLIVERTVLEIVWRKAQKQFDDIVFIGTSMGGKLAYQIAQLLRFQLAIRTKALLIDAPLGRRDFQRPLDLSSPALRFLPYVPVLNLIYVVPFLERLIMNVLFVVPPKEADIDEGLTRAERVNLDNSVTEARKTKTPFHRDQVLSILEPLGTEFGSPWDKGDVVYMRSGRDNDTVRDSAYESWRELLGYDIHRLRLPKAKHCAYGQNPRSYRPAFRQGFSLLKLP